MYFNGPDAFGSDDIQDGSGRPEIVQWHEFDVNEFTESVTMANVLKLNVDKWMNKTDVKNFLHEFMVSDKQESFKEYWSGLGINEVADRVRSGWLEVLTNDAWPRELLLCAASARSPIKAMLLKRVLLATRDKKVHEDTSICDQINGTCNLGILYDIIEDYDAWPVFKKKIKKDDPGMLRWFGLDDTGGIRIPLVEDENMKTLIIESINKQITDGSFTIVQLSEDLALTKLYTVYKSDRKDKIRFISDFLRSGVNSRIKIGTTICLPRFFELIRLIQNMVYTEMSIADVEGAYRLLENNPDEAKFLCYLHPLDSSVILQDNLLPFGLLSSPLIWCRVSAAYHRVQKRLIGLIDSIDYAGTVLDMSIDDLCKFLLRNRIRFCVRKGIIYVDDSGMLGGIRTLVLMVVIKLVFGIKVEFAKVKCGSIVKTLGYMLDLENKTIQVPDDKIDKTVEVIDEACRLKFILTDDLESLVGKCESIFVLYPEYAMKLGYFRSILAVCEKKNIKKYVVNQKLKSALYDIRNTLTLSIGPVPVPIWKHVVVMMSDASNSRISFCLKYQSQKFYDVKMRGSDKWVSDLLCDLDIMDHSVVHINVFELIAVFSGLCFIETISSDVLVSLSVDNKSVISWLRKWRSKNKIVNSILQMMKHWRFKLRVRHVRSKENVIADALTRIPLRIMSRSLNDWIKASGNVYGE